MTSIPVSYTELQAQRMAAVEDLYRAAMRLASVLLGDEGSERQARRNLERAALAFAASDRSVEQRTAPAPPSPCDHSWEIQGSWFPRDDGHRMTRRCTRCGLVT